MLRRSIIGIQKAGSFKGQNALEESEYISFHDFPFLFSDSMALSLDDKALVDFMYRILNTVGVCVHENNRDLD